MTDARKLRFETRLIHAGERRPRFAGAAVMPIFQSTVFEQPEDATYDGIVYPRLSTLPNHVALVDNTFATAVNFRPLDIGYDVGVHSATKYLNGHSDQAAGVVLGSRAFVDRAKHLLNHLGGALDPHGCFLLDRGTKTLALRVRH